MADVSGVEAGYRLSLNHPEPVFEYSKDDGPPGPSPFILVAKREIVMRRIASESAKSWHLKNPIAVKSRWVLRKREWGFVVSVFGLGMKEYLSDYGYGLEELMEAREGVYWHPVIWCATHPVQCYEGAFNEVFFEGPGAEFRYDEFISMDSRDSVSVPNLPPETHFPVGYCK